ncbi:MAG: CinA family nicotinamide mononucleotide deamidase-related protein, partial [Deltaproteobacteria bacterium]|nr:CinA family nicotinamide mononucleotide deamidase-related protein [Deltaproteobacteria bacterium]
MIIEILATGDEIRTGAVIDRNSAHIAQVLEQVGLEATRHSCVGDDMDMMISIIKEIGGRADVAVVTGGLGPTSDDITAEAAANAKGVDLVLNRSALGVVEKYFKTRKLVMSPSNKKQAMLPRGAESLHNPVGSAPGIFIKIGRCLFFFVPGVPFEMKRMISNEVLPRIEKLHAGTDELSMVKTISTFGLTESAIGELLFGLSTEFPEIKPGFRSRFPEIQVKLYIKGKDIKVLRKLMEKVSQSIYGKLEKNIFSMNGSSMEAVVGGLLAEKKETIAVAESCTGGLISHMLTNVPGSSGYFLFSGVTYSNEAKKKVLGVSSEVLEQYGAVHEETVKKMALGVRRVAGATYGLATSGIAGPDGGT